LQFLIRMISFQTSRKAQRTLAEPAMLLAVALLGVSSLAWGQIESAIPETHSDLPVLVSVVTYKGNLTGSGFILQHKSSWYLITAKHVLFQRDSVRQEDTLIGRFATLRIVDPEPDDTSVSILLLDLEAIQSDNRILYHKESDVAAIGLGIADTAMVRTASGVRFLQKSHHGIATRGIAMLSRYTDVKLGNDVYVYGYPTSIGLVSMPQFDSERPLLRKGIVAGKYGRRHTIILDCPVYYGNSGGPVVQESPDTRGLKFKIVGIVTEWIPFDESKANRKTVPIGALYTNSGYAVAESVDTILEILP